MLNIAKTAAIRLTLATVVALGVSASAGAKDYSVGSNAKSWNLQGQEKAMFTGKVVDLLCELAGDCVDNCGGSTRNLGILRSDDNKLITVMKNTQAAFNGGSDDLLPYCGQIIDADGLMIGDDEVVKAKFYQIQLVRVSGTEKWNKTTLWTKNWKKNNPGATGKGPWFRRDPRVKKQIAAQGHFGSGHAVDQQFIEDNQ